MLEGLYSSYLIMSYQKLLQTLEHYALDKKDTVTKDAHSIESFQILWLKVVTLQIKMEQAENLSMDKLLKMKISF